MRKYTSIIIFTLACLTVVSCEKAGLRLTAYSLPTDKAFLRIALLSPNTPNVMIKSNDVKINGNATAGFSGIFPSTFTFPDFCSVDPGATIKLSLPNTGTQNDSVVLFTSKIGLEAGKYYSLTLADTGVNRTGFSIEDKFIPQVDSFTSVRLINATVGATLNFIRVDSNNATDFVRDTIARNVAYKNTSGFVSVKTFTTRAFIRLRVATTSGVALIGAAIPPQTLATGSRRSITVYSTGFIDGLTGQLIPQLFTSPVTNQ